MELKWDILLFTVVLTNCNCVEVYENGMFYMPDLRSICGHFKEVDTVSEICEEQLDTVCSNITLLLTMMGASSKYPFTGMGYTTRNEIGNFDQCMSINRQYEGGRILGEYCGEGLIIPDYTKIENGSFIYNTLAVCRPYACRAADYNDIVRDLIDPIFSEVFQDVGCKIAESRKSFTVLDKITSALFLTIILLMISSTTYEVYVIYMDKNAHPLLIAFSVVSNGKKLLYIPTNFSPKERFETFEGLRVISMMWIIAGHAFMAWDIYPVLNGEEWQGDSALWQKQLSAGYILTAHLAVDTFFFMSGFLVAFHYLKFRQKSLVDQIWLIPKMYLQRYIRLTIPLIMIYLTVISLFKHLESGPIWFYSEEYTKNCSNHWLPVLLHIQNYYNYDDVCLLHTWFLSVVMQLFIISPIILIPLTFTLRKQSGLRKALMHLLVINIICAFLPMVQKLYNIKYNNYDTQSRLIDYFIGMMLAVFMRETVDKPFLYRIKETNRGVVNIITWMLTLLGMMVTVICYQKIQIDNRKRQQILFESLMRPAWCTGLSWIIYSCYYGHGGFINWILCRPSFQVLGRLTFCIYLVHQTVIDYYASTTRIFLYFSEYRAFYLFCGHYVVSAIVALFWTLAFESPFIVLEKYLTKPRSEQKEDNIALSESRIIVKNTQRKTTGQLADEGYYIKNETIF